jgi:uncharacterized protein YjeT (DUF2065 family)
VATSVFLARLIGPFTLVLGVALLLNATVMRGIVDEVIASPALIFLSGALTLPAGIAILLVHHRWYPDWRALITLLGYLTTLAGVIRMLAPQIATRIKGLSRITPIALRGIGAGYAAAGAVLCYFGYLHH